MHRAAACAAVACLVATAAPALAQSADAVVEVEAATDLRMRGLSWSDGRPALAASAWLPLGNALEADVRVATLRGSVRHGGADAGIDVGLQAVQDAGGWRLSAGVAGHAFVGARGLHYGEARARAAYALGPATLGLSAAYAPEQAAIGGDNLYLSADLQAGVPGTPWTLVAGAGRSSGSGDGNVRARRLRPDGTYSDWRLGAEYVRAPFVAGLRLTGTSADAREADVPALRYVDRHTGTRLAGYLRLEL